MHTFPELIKEIRQEAGLTQAEFAKAVGVSPVLITMVETGQKDVSKRLLLKLAHRLNVHPSSITPFLFIDNKLSDFSESQPEKMFISWGQKMQKLLIKKRAQRLKKYAGK